jgi:hypothetical protein
LNGSSGYRSLAKSWNNLKLSLKKSDKKVVAAEASRGYNAELEKRYTGVGY